MHATGKPVVFVNCSGSAVAMPWEAKNLPAILQAWYPGEEGGTAVAQALAGDFSPAGRLPVTFYKSTEQLPAFEDYSMDKRTYRYFDGEQDTEGCKVRYDLSPRGEGLFETDWIARKVDPDADAAKAEQFGAPGKMAIVYGVPIGVEYDGVVHLKYRFVQVIDKKSYDTHVFDYGRFGQPFTYLK